MHDRPETPCCIVGIQSAFFGRRPDPKDIDGFMVDFLELRARNGVPPDPVPPPSPAIIMNASISFVPTRSIALMIPSIHPW